MVHLLALTRRGTLSSNTVQHLPTQPSSISGAPLAYEDAGTQAVKRMAKLMPQLSPPHLLPGLLDPVTIDLDRSALTDNDSPCASGKLRKDGRPNHYRGFSRPCDIPKLDYGLPRDFSECVRSRAAATFTDFELILAVPGFGRVTPERQARAVDLDDFAFVIPLDCPTSTPVAAGKRASKKDSLGSGAGAGAAASAGVGPSPRRITSPRTRILPGQ
jgi:hypothetical protein